MGMFMISCVSAVEIVAGEQYSFELSEDYDYYSIVGNSSPINLKISPDGLNITIITDKYSQSDSFEIIFFNKEKEIITEHHYSSGSTITKTITEYIDNYITEYKDKIIIDDEEIQRLNDELKKRQDEIDKRNRALILSLVGFLALLCVMMFLIYKLVKKIKNAQK